MVMIPPEMLEKIDLKAGQEVLLTSEESAIRVEPSVVHPRPKP